MEMTARGKHGKARAAFPPFPPPLGNLANTARFPHSHSLASPRMEKWKTTSRFPTFPRGGSRPRPMFASNRTKNRRKEVGRCAASFILTFQDHSVLEMELGFRIILGLENATSKSIEKFSH